jgi:CubicO group peptidase (beta-lactamase class C family)
MSESVLKAATSLYSEAVARGDILGVVLLVARRGKVVLYEAMGVRDKEKNLPMGKDTLFQIKSMTKPMVASAALILAEQGKLQLDAPVSRYIPAFATGRSKEINVRQLMNHTSGFRIPSDFIPKTNDLIAEQSTLEREVARGRTLAGSWACGRTGGFVRLQQSGLQHAGCCHRGCFRQHY